MDLDRLEHVLQVSPLTLIATLIAVILGLMYLVLKDKGLPPGPIGLPLVGYWPFLRYESGLLQFQELKAKYGEVFCFTIAGKLFINLASIKAMKEAHINKADCFSQRISDFSVVKVAFGKGIAQVNGEEWRVVRKFFVQSFREYGLTSVKDYMAGSIYDSVNATVETLKSTGGSTFNIIPVINLRSSAIFRRMIFKDEVTEEDMKFMIDCYEKIFRIFIGKNRLLVGDFAKKYLYPRLSSYKPAVESSEVMRGFLRKIIRKHEETFDADNIRDIIDSYIKERKERSSKGDPSAEYFDEDTLIGSLIQFMGDGIFTVAIFIAYFINALLEYPEEQDKVYKELVDVVGNNRAVALEDRNSLPYTNAFMQEVMRTSDISTYLPSLECTRETTINGYKIPVGSITVTHFWVSQRDPSVFEDPDSFKPSRYLVKPKAEAPVLFGVGKRSCAGEAFTMMQVFLFLTAIVKNFRLKCPDGENKKSFLDGEMNIRAFPRN